MHPCKSHTASRKEYTRIHVLTHWKHTYDNRKHIHILTKESCFAGVYQKVTSSTSKNIEHNQLLVRKTGEGESLVYLVTGACIGVVTLCISPLLSLAMDQSRKVMKHAPNT